MKRAGKPIGVLLLAFAAAALGFALATPTGLAGQVVTAAGSGMTATAEGIGGAKATNLEPGWPRLGRIDVLGTVPLAPVVYLLPVGLTRDGVQVGTQPAYWKVWWNASSQTMASISLQQHVNSTDAAAVPQNLDARDTDPMLNFGDSDLHWTSESTFPMADVPGALGYLWEGIFTDEAVKVEARLAVFARGPVAAVVAIMSYGQSTDASAFNALAQAEYGAMTPGLRAPLGYLAAIVLALAGAIFISVARRRRDPLPMSVLMPSPGWTTPGWYPDPDPQGPAGGLRYWDGRAWTPATAVPTAVPPSGGPAPPPPPPGPTPVRVDLPPR